MRIRINPDPLGLGAVVGELSLLIHANQHQTLDVLVPSTDNLFCRLLKLLNIQNLNIVVDDQSPAFSLETYDCPKLFSPYFQVNHEPDNNSFAHESHIKKFILVALSHNEHPLELEYYVSKNPAFPFNRYYSSSTYFKILENIYLAGYDIVTVNSHYGNNLSLEEIVHYMRYKCAGVIGYEGGIVQLAHLFNLPTIVFPWHHDLTGRDEPSYRHMAHALNIDDLTFIPDDVEEFAATLTPRAVKGFFQPEIMKSMLSNNRFLKNYPSIEINNNQVDVYFENLPPETSYFRPMLHETEMTFIQKVLPQPFCFGGYPTQTLVNTL